MPNESAPPIRELPAEIEAAIFVIADDFDRLPRTDRVRRRHQRELDELRNAIRNALDDQDAALRERCERIRVRLLALTEGRPVRPIAFVESVQGLKPGDLADDLIPRKGDVLP